MSKRALKRLATYICFMLCVIVLGNVTVFADEVKPTDSIKTEWTDVASMSTVRNYFQTVVVEGKIYAIGGPGLSSAEEYDPIIDKWTTISSMSVTRQLLQAVVIDGKIYAIGGSGNDGNTLSSMEVYDPSNDKWTSLSPMSRSRMKFQTEVINGKIYVIGGQSNYQLIPSTEMYDPISNKWTTLSSMSIARGNFRTEVINGKIYAIGGSGLSSAEVYDPSTDKWTTLSSMSTERQELHTEVINGKIYVIGGGSPSSAEVYDPSTNKWSIISSMSVARQYFQTEVINGKIYVIGGSGHSSVEVYITPNIVTNLRATAGNSKIDLTWDAVDKATSYTIKRSTTVGGPYETILTDVAGTTYTDTNVTNGTTYYYIVSAINASTEIGNSNEASAKPTEDQTPPTTDSKLKVVMEISEALRLSVDNDLNVNTQMVWESSEPTVATVNEKGIVTALAPGNTVITVKSADGSYTDYINVLVVENADDYRLAIDLRVGETARLTADDFTNTANVTWAPMDSAIANVTTKGKVTALSKGLVLISAKDAEGNIIGRVYVRVRE